MPICRITQFDQTTPQFLNSVELVRATTSNLLARAAWRVKAFDLQTLVFQGQAGAQRGGASGPLGAGWFWSSLAAVGGVTFY